MRSRGVCVCVTMVTFTLACELADKSSFGSAGVWAGLAAAVQWHAHFSRLQSGPVPRALLPCLDLRTVHPAQDSWRILIAQTQPHTTLTATHRNTDIITNEIQWVVSGPKRKANLKKENKKKTNISSIFHRFRKTWINDDRIITPGWTIAFALHIISLPTRSSDWDFKEMSSVIFLSYNLPIGSKRTQYTNVRRMRSECFMHSAFRASITLIKQQPRGMCALMTRYWTRRDVDHFEVSFAFKQHIKTVMETRTERAMVQNSMIFSKNSSKNVLDNFIIQLIIYFAISHLIF